MRIFNVVISLLICVIYIQHDHVVEDYRRQNNLNTISEQSIKHEMRAEMQKNLLIAENQVLEERTQLSQTLHDKLGHNINGSVYQLEAVKVLMEKDPEKAKSMIQAVIDQLRGGMDEIRAILRRKRPEKHRLAVYTKGFPPYIRSYNNLYPVISFFKVYRRNIINLVF